MEMNMTKAQTIKGWLREMTREEKVKFLKEKVWPIELMVDADNFGLLDKRMHINYYMIDTLEEEKLDHLVFWTFASSPLWDKTSEV